MVTSSENGLSASVITGIAIGSALFVSFLGYGSYALAKGKSFLGMKLGKKIRPIRQAAPKTVVVSPTSPAEVNGLITKNI